MDLNVKKDKNPAEKAEIAIQIMKSLENKEEDAKILKALRQKEGELVAKKVQFVMEKKRIMDAARRAGTTSEKVKQGILIKECAKEDTEVAKLWEDAKKGRKSVDEVYRRVVKKQEIENNIESGSKPEEEIAKDTIPILAQVNDKLRTEIKKVKGEVKEWKNKFFDLKAKYELLENKYDALKNSLNKYANLLS